MTTAQVFDVAVIGGGVNGAGIARDLSGRGVSVLLIEAGDLARGTSSASSKLIHGGLRYLEHYEFALVREALSERERLWAIAPHIIRPMRFVLPYVAGLRPRWMLRAGLFAYDHIGARKRLPATETIDLRRHVAGGALKPAFHDAFVYSDCWVDDARLVVLNARDAADRGAVVRTRTPATRLERRGEGWAIATPDTVHAARAVVNAAGPGVLDVLERTGETPDYGLRLVRGSHIVVPRRFDHDHPYFFQLPDGRIFFAIPYEDDCTLIGTTDVDHTGRFDAVEPSVEEVAYLCDGASRFFARPVVPADVVWSYAGVRPLVDDHSGKPEAATRGYRLDLSPRDHGAPLLSVFGGKITTYRHLAEAAVDMLRERLPQIMDRPWTADAALPGGDFPVDETGARMRAFAQRYPFLEPQWATRLFRAYGTAAETVLGDARTIGDCGVHFGHGLTAREVRHLVEREWAMTADDILWRRTKLGLRLSPEQVGALERYLEEGKP